MDQLGHLLLGLVLAWPLLSIVRAMIRQGQESHIPEGHDLRRESRSLPPCDPKAVAEYFASLLPRTKADPAQALSLAEFTQLLRDSGHEVPPVHIRFDGEGGYQLRL
jgi:glycogen debranching enzyme